MKSYHQSIYSVGLTPQPPLLTTKTKSVVRRGGAEQPVLLPSPEVGTFTSGEGPGVRLNSCLPSYQASKKLWKPSCLGVLVITNCSQFELKFRDVMVGIG
jgi:hypothetical protein